MLKVIEEYYENFMNKKSKNTPELSTSEEKLIETIKDKTVH